MHDFDCSFFARLSAILDPCMLRAIESYRDLHVLCATPQVEVVQSAVVTDYSDALLLPNGMIEELNGTIKGSGAQKVSILEEIKAGGKQVRAGRGIAVNSLSCVGFVCVFV